MKRTCTSTRERLKTHFFAFQTSATSGILLYLLANNPEAQERLRAEVLRVLPDRDAELHEHAFDHTPYMQACIKESMRLQPIFSGVLRSAGQNLILNGYRIPMNVSIYLVVFVTGTACTG